MARNPKQPRKGRAPSYSDFRRLSPSENKQLGFTPKARHYVLKSVRKVTKRTSSISARAHETLRTRQEYGFAKPEIATLARSHKALGYKTAAQGEAVAKAAITRENKAFVSSFLQSTLRDAASGVRVRKAGGKGKGQLSFRVKVDTAGEALRNRDKRLKGEFIPDGEYQQMLDYLAHYNDRAYDLLRGSPKDKTGNIEEDEAA